MNNNNTFKEWDILVDSQSSLLDLNLLEIWKYRELLWVLVKRDFVSFYKQTILGPLWFFIQPLFTTIIFTFIFGNVAGISTDGLPRPLFYMAGITAWNYFADCLTKTSSVFRDSSHIFSKVYFPRLIMPLSIIVSNLVRFGVQMLMFFVMMGYYYLQSETKVVFQPNIYMLMFPFLVIMMALLGLGIGLVISALTIKYRDLGFLVNFGIQLMMYATTVIYPLSAAPLKYKWLIELNPMTGIIETFRYGFLGAGYFTISTIGYSIVLTLIFLFLGVIIFNKVEKTFVDTI
jgi:lipopolysaccharide transport system permease protein